MTGVESRMDDMYCVRSFAPPIWPESKLITKLALSSTRSTAGSDSLDSTCEAIALIMIPDAIMPMIQSHLSNVSSTDLKTFL